MGRRHAVALLVIAATATGCGTSTGSTSAEDLDLRLVDRPGRATLSDLADGPALVNVFASWCTPCRTEAPLLEEAAARAVDVAVIGVAVNDRIEEVGSFASDLELTYPIGVDDRHEAVAGLGVTQLPTTLLLDGTGRIIATHPGEVDAADLTALLERLPD